MHSVDHRSYIFETVPTLSTVCRHSLFFCCPLRVCLLGEAESTLTAAFQRLICVARARLINRTPSLVSCGSFTLALFIPVPIQSTSFVRCCPTNGTTLIVALHFFQTVYSTSFQTGWYNRDQTNSMCKRVRHFWLVTVISTQVLANCLKVHPPAPH